MSNFIFNEPMPDCVPELYRSQQEEADRLYEAYLYDQAHYEMNRAKLHGAAASGFPILPFGGYGPCWNCKDADTDTMTDAEDDTCTIICHNPDCRCHKEEGRERLHCEYEAGEISEADEGNTG